MNLQASQLLRQRLEGNDQMTRGETAELFASALLYVLDPVTEYSNGETIDALEAALNSVAVPGNPQWARLAEYLSKLEEGEEE